MSYQYRIHGHSDDLIEVEGHETREFNANLNEPTYVTVGGTVLRVEYNTDGIWRIEIDELGPRDVVLRFGQKRQYVENECNDYTEMVVVGTEVERCANLEELVDE